MVEQSRLQVHYWFDGIVFSRPIPILLENTGFEHEERFESWIAKDAEKYPDVIYFWTKDGSTDIFKE